MSEVCVAIGRQLHAEYVPVLAAPLPSQLKNLVARLVALEAARLRPTAISEICAVAQPEQH